MNSDKAQKKSQVNNLVKWDTVDCGTNIQSEQVYVLRYES